MNFLATLLCRTLKRYELADMKDERSELSVRADAGNISSCSVITNTAFAKSDFEKSPE